MLQDDATEYIDPRQDAAIERSNPRRDAATEHVMFFQQRRAQCRALALRLWRQKKAFVLGRDDSLLHNYDIVYVVDSQDFGFPTPIQRIDYFHGMIGGYVMAQMCHNEENVKADDMLSMCGCFANAIACIQRAFRGRRRLVQVEHIRRALAVGQLIPMCIRDRLIVEGVARYLP
jgi:hypothetical protein